MVKAEETAGSILAHSAKLEVVRAACRACSKSRSAPPPATTPGEEEEDRASMTRATRWSCSSNDTSLVSNPDPDPDPDLGPDDKCLGSRSAPRVCARQLLPHTGLPA